MTEITSHILIVGSGGREHALAWKLSLSPLVTVIYLLPGNCGTASLKKCHNVPGSWNHRDDIVAFALEAKVTLFIPTMEQWLVEGIVDDFMNAGIPCFGPTKDAAQLEGSKSFSKHFMVRHGIPTASFRVFDDFGAAEEYVFNEQRDLVIKASGITSGKGVFLTRSDQEALQALKKLMLHKDFGKAGNQVIVEEVLKGNEASIIVLTDGLDFQIISSARDYKRLNDNDSGPITGGMGCHSPVPILNASITEIENLMIRSTITGLRRDGILFAGVLVLGIMLTADGPQLLEYDVRLGDPETQTLALLLATDFAEILIACMQKKLAHLPLILHEGSCVTVVLASEGYPAYISSREQIRIRDDELPQEAMVFHSGTVQVGDKIFTTRGRVLAISVVANSLKEASKCAYDVMKHIEFRGMHYRTDIGA